MRQLLILGIFLTGCSESSFVGIDPASQCFPEQVSDGVQFTCKDGSTYTVKNGLDGSDGLDGEDSFIVDVIDPCGQETTHDEVLLLTEDGNYLAYFSNGTDSRLSLLSEGILYRTTDGTNCRFSIDSGILTDNL